MLQNLIRGSIFHFYIFYSQLYKKGEHNESANNNRRIESSLTEIYAVTRSKKKS